MSTFSVKVVFLLIWAFAVECAAAYPLDITVSNTSNYRTLFEKTIRDANPIANNFISLFIEQQNFKEVIIMFCPEMSSLVDESALSNLLQRKSLQKVTENFSKIVVDANIVLSEQHPAGLIQFFFELSGSDGKKVNVVIKIENETKCVWGFRLLPTLVDLNDGKVN